MTTTLTGANRFLLRQKIEKLTADFAETYGDLAIEKFDGTEAEVAVISGALASLPFLASKKLVVLTEPGASPDFVNAAEKLLSELPETTDLIIVEPKLDKRSSYFKALKKLTDFREFNELDATGLARWLVEKAKVNGGEISFVDARFLVERVGASQQQLASELEKLMLYNPKINRETIEKLTEPTPQSKTFDLLDAAFAGNKKLTMKLYAEQRALKVEPQQIIALLAWQIHLLALSRTAGNLSANEIAKQAGVSLYPVEKSQKLAAKLTLANIKKLTGDLLALDARLKSENLDPDEALKLYLLGISK